MRNSSQLRATISRSSRGRLAKWLSFFVFAISACCIVASHIGFSIGMNEVRSLPSFIKRFDHQDFTFLHNSAVPEDQFEPLALLWDLEPHHPSLSIFRTDSNEDTLQEIKNDRMDGNRKDGNLNVEDEGEFYTWGRPRPPIDYMQEWAEFGRGKNSSDAFWNDTGSIFGPCDAFSSGIWGFGKDEKYMWYASHSGFGNQVIQLKWALRIAGLLNRTLIVPPKTPRFSHIKGLGNCAGLITPPNNTRLHAWSVYSLLLRHPNYVSMGDILNLGNISEKIVKTIDLRHFVSIYCGCNISISCFGKFCFHVDKNVSAKRQSSSYWVAWFGFGSFHGQNARYCLSRCGKMLGSISKPTFEFRSIFPVQHTCGDTVWTIGNYTSLRELKQSINKTTDILNFVWENAEKGENVPEPRNLLQTLGPKSLANSALAIAFGSTFHPRIVDMYLEKWPEMVAKLFQVSDELTFTPQIWLAAKEYARNVIKQDYFCLHFRAGDGHFAIPKEQKKYLSLAKSKLRKLHEEDGQKIRRSHGQSSSAKLSLFLMTDILQENNSDSVSKFASSLGFELHSLHCSWQKRGGAMQSWDAMQSFVINLLQSENGFLSNRLVANAIAEMLPPLPEADFLSGTRRTPSKSFKRMIFDFCFYVEQAICSCASLGFHGTPLSTASNFISKLRKQQACGVVSNVNAS